MIHLLKQIKLLDREITQQKRELSADWASLKQKTVTSPSLLKGFLWGFSLGYVVLAPRLKYITKNKTASKHVAKEKAIHRYLLSSLPTLLKLI